MPVQIINDFEGSNVYLYSFQNTVVADISSINISQLPFTSTTIQLNQVNINQQTAIRAPIIGTIVSEYQSTIVNAVTSFGFNGVNYQPILQYTTGSSNYYNTFSDSRNIEYTPGEYSDLMTARESYLMLYTFSPISNLSLQASSGTRPGLK